MSTIYLVSCVSKKVEGSAKAKDLYVSPWFQRARCYVEQQNHPWFILSAKHGLLNPDKEIEKYDCALSNKKEDRRQWAEKVFKKLDPDSRGVKRIVFLAGKRYRELLSEKLIEKGIAVCVPMEGKGIGKQLRWLNEQLTR